MIAEKVERESGGAGGAVAFAGEKLGGTPAFVASEVEADKIGDRFEIAFEAVKLLRIGAGGRAAEAGADGIDEDHVAKGQKRVVVIDEGVRRLGLRAIGAHLDALGTESTHVQPDGGGTGTAIKYEGDGTFGCVTGIVTSVGDEEDAGAGFAFLFLEKQGAGEGGIGELLAGGVEGVLGFGDFFDGLGRGEFFVGGGFSGGGRRRVLGGLRECGGEGQQRQGGDSKQMVFVLVLHR